MIGSLLAVWLCLTPTGQEVKLQLSDGTIVQGELKGFEGGKYRIQINGTIHEYAEGDVITVTMVETAKPRTDVVDSSDVIRMVKEGRDGAKAADALVRMLGFLDADGQKRLLEQVAAALATRLAELFAQEFADGLGRAREHKSELAKMLEAAGRAAEKDKRAGSAWRLYRAAGTLDKTLADAVKAGRIAQALAFATERIQAGDGANALQAIDDLLALQPENADAKRLREEALHLKLQADLQKALGERRNEILREYLRIVTKPEYRKWAEEQLAKPTETVVRAPMSEELARYFPVEVGRWWKFRVGSGTDLYQKVKVEAVRTEDAGTRVYYSLENIYKNYTSTKSYQLLITADAVSMSSAYGEGSTAFPLLKLPLRSGETWEWQSGGQRFVREITSGGKSVTTDAGTFENSLEVTFTSTLTQEGKETRIVSRSSYAPGVGLVQLSFDHPDYKKYDLVLESHGKE